VRKGSLKRNSEKEYDKKGKIKVTLTMGKINN